MNTCTVNACGHPAIGATRTGFVCALHAFRATARGITVVYSCCTDFDNVPVGLPAVEALRVRHYLQTGEVL